MASSARVTIHAVQAAVHYQCILTFSHEARGAHERGVGARSASMHGGYTTEFQVQLYGS